MPVSSATPQEEERQQSLQQFGFEDSLDHRRKPTKQKIGSIKNAKINYPPD